MMKRKETYVRKTIHIPKAVIRRSLRESVPVPRSYTQGKKLPFTVSLFNTRSGGIKNRAIDNRKTALPSGIRVSKSGRVYPESRRNRSDLRDKGGL